MSSNGHVQIKDFSDREILLMILDLGGEVSTPELATRIYGWSAVEAEDKNMVEHGRRCVGSRLSWMRRFGLVDSMIETKQGRPVPGTRTWKPSPAGKNMIGVTLPRVVELGLMRTSDNDGLVLANRIGEKLVKAGEITGTAMRRELQFQINRRRQSR